MKNRPPLPLVTFFITHKLLCFALFISLALHGIIFCVFQFLPAARPVTELPSGPDAFRLFLEASDTSASGERSSRAAPTAVQSFREQDGSVTPDRNSLVTDVSHDTATPEHHPDQDTGAEGNAVFQPLFTGLKNRLESLKRYPEQARAGNIQGVVILLLTLDPDGVIAASGIFHSSGSMLLDNDALKLVKKATPFPHDLGTSVNLIIPIAYRLTDPVDREE